jgi:hypothetical protein
MIQRIFIDLDGVLNRFTMFALLLMGAPIDLSVSENQWWHWGDADIVDVFNELTGRSADKPMSEDEFWASLPERAWAETPLTPEAYWLVDFCESLVGEENVSLLTSQSSNPNCASGKRKWIAANMPKLLDRSLIGKCKYMCAHPTTLLVDDFEKNVNKFRRFGGQTILVPRPWNKAQPVADIQAYLQSQLLDWFK